MDIWDLTEAGLNMGFKKEAVRLFIRLKLIWYLFIYSHFYKSKSCVTKFLLLKGTLSCDFQSLVLSKQNTINPFAVLCPISRSKAFSNMATDSQRYSTKLTALSCHWHCSSTVDVKENQIKRTLPKVLSRCRIHSNVLTYGIHADTPHDKEDLQTQSICWLTLRWVRLHVD
jgi:hypothetical protein